MSFNNVSDEYWAEKLRRENCDQFNTLVRMHLSFVLDLHTDDNESATEKSKFKKWNFVPFTKKPKSSNKGVMDGAPLTQEGICQVYQLIEYLGKEPNICAEGIFRRTGSLSRQQELRSLLNQGLPLNLDGGRYSVHDCASVLKGFLHEQPEPLLTDAHYQAHLQVAELCGSLDKQSNETRLLRSLQLLLLLLPSENRVLLKDVLLLLNKTASYESSNKMSAESLATLFTPHLLCPRKLSPENLHIDSQTLSGIVAFMIRKANNLFKIPPKLAVDIKAYFTEREKRRILSPNKELNESVSDNFAANTVYSFVDHEKTAQAHLSNPTEAALAQLYAYIQGLPESSKKRKLVKQFNKENGNGTPLQLQRSQKTTLTSKSLGDSIKKHIFQKGFTKTIKRSANGQLSQIRSSSEEVLNSPNCIPMGAKTKLFCVDCDSSSDNEIKERDEENNETSPKPISKSDDSLNISKKDECQDLVDCLQEFSVRRSSSDVSKSARCFSEPDLSSDTGERYWASYLTSTPAGLPLRPSKEVDFTPVCAGRKSMSPITRSTQRMCKAMQETMMTPRSRKPVLLMSGTNICNLPKMDLGNRSSISDLEEEPEPEPEDSIKEEEDIINSNEENEDTFDEEKISIVYNNKKLKTKSKSESNIQSTPNHKYSTYSETGDTLTNTFREYLCSRSILTATPQDSSFSSRTDDYDSANEDIPSEDKLTESLLYCLDGNKPPSLDNSENSFRKRSAIEDDDEIDSKKFIVEKELVLKPKQFGANGEPIIYETSF